jgi:predicted ATP-binding protein involved in virulence
MARWIDRARRLGQAVPPRFNQKMEGLVLVDEVDLHLHPRWQLRILADLRDLFPRLSFVVTTHHGLTLLGARPGEIFVLVRDGETQAIEARQIDLPKGLRADQVLTGEWFGLASTLDPETLDLLERHRVLLRTGALETHPERRALEGELRKRLGSFGETAMDQLVQSVAAEIIDETYTEPTPAERTELRERIKRLARERLENKRKPSRRDAE